MKGLQEFGEWKDAVITLEALPSNVLARLCVIASKISRSKSKLRTEMRQLLGVTRGLAQGILLDAEVQRHRYSFFEESLCMESNNDPKTGKH